MKTTEKARFLTIRQAAAEGPLSEYHLRRLCKQGRLPGLYSGPRFLIDYDRLLEQLHKTGGEISKEGDAL